MIPILSFYFVEAASEISNSESLQYDFGTLRAATDNFSDANKLGDGFRNVFKVKINDPFVVFVKWFHMF